MDAVVVRAHGSCAVEPLDLRPIGARDVLVRIDASGICHSDVSVLDGTLGRSLPVVLGHEGAGAVIDVGRDVTRVRAGDRVVLAAIAPCGHCYFCARAQPYACERARDLAPPPFLDGERPIPGTSGLGTLADAVVVDERVVVPVETDLPAAQLAMLGCAVMTGAGSVLNLATVTPGDSVLVIGAGGVGLAAVQAARAQGAWPIAVIDPAPGARDAAARSGASHAVAPGESGALVDLTGGRGFDAVFECVGYATTMQAAWGLTRRGGTMVVIGVGPRSEQMPFPIVDVPLSGRKLVGCIYGGASVHRDVQRFVTMAERGALDLGALLGRTIALGDAPAAMTATTTHPGRTVVVNPT